MDDVIEFPKKSGPGVGHRPRKRAGATTPVTVNDFNADDEVKNLEALKLRMSQMLARPDISERDFKAISIEYRAVNGELKEARDRAAAEQLGKRRGPKLVGGRTFDGDI
jgi:hypothetical protein